MRLLSIGIAAVIFLMFFSGSALACGERDVVLVDSMDEAATTMTKSRCSKVFFPTNDENKVVVEKSEIRITDHQAKHILEDYLEQEYGDSVHLSAAASTEIPGHEKHNHGHGKLQDTHGTISYSFLVEGGAYGGKAYPMFVDAKTGEVYGVGCGFGAGKVVFSPDLSYYPDSDQSDTSYHEASQVDIEDVNFNFLGSITGFFYELFGF